MSNNRDQKIKAALRKLNEYAREDPEMWPPVYRAVLKRAGFASLKDWAQAKPKEFFLFVEQCGAEVDDGEEPQFSPNPVEGTARPERVL